MKDEINIYSDGGARGNPGPAASAFVVFKNKEIVHKGFKYIGETTNNIAEYTAVIMAFDWLIKNKDSVSSSKVIFFVDSQLVVSQLKGIFKIKNPNIKELVYCIKKKEWEFKFNVEYQHIPRTENFLADSLVNKALDEKLD